MYRLFIGENIAKECRGLDNLDVLHVAVIKSKKIGGDRDASKVLIPLAFHDRVC